jgi:hypothetical protein
MTDLGESVSREPVGEHGLEIVSEPGRCIELAVKGEPRLLLKPSTARLLASVLLKHADSAGSRPCGREDCNG